MKYSIVCEVQSDILSILLKLSTGKLCYFQATQPRGNGNGLWDELERMDVCLL